jgi:hypothetical protein
MALTKVTQNMLSGGEVNVLDYGADPTGATESHTAIQAAVNAVGAKGAIYIPDGTYKVTETITFAQGTSVGIYGQSREGTIIQSGLTAIDAAKYVFHYQGDDAVTANLCQNVTISTLTINALYFGAGIFAEHCFPNFVIKEVEVFKPYNYGMYLDNCWGASISDCLVDGDNYTRLYGYYLINANNICMYNNRVYNMQSTGQSTGIGATSCENFSIFGGNVENCPRGIYLTIGGTFDGPATIRDVYFEPRSMQPFDAGQPNDHIKVLGDTADNGSVLVEGCLFQAGSGTVPIAYNGVSAQNLGTLTLISNVWQKARYTAGGQGENYFVDVDTTVDKVIEIGNTLISTALGAVRQMPIEVVHTYNNAEDTGSQSPGNNLSKFSAVRSTAVGPVTGDGTAYTVVFNSQEYDASSEYDDTTGIFTARRSGYYSFTTGVSIDMFSTANEGILDFVTSNGAYRLATFNPTAARGASTTITFSGAVNCYMDAGDTAKVVITLSGSTFTDYIFAGDRRTYFSGIQIT